MPQKVRTAFGNSETTYRVSHILEDFNNNMQGLLQGNGSVPQIWYILSSVIFTALREQGFGIHFYNSFTSKLTQLVVFRYVDDCDLIQSGDNLSITHQDMQDALSVWEAKIEVTEGFLAYNKSAWHLVDYKWHQGKWKCTNPSIQKT